MSPLSADSCSHREVPSGNRGLFSSCPSFQLTAFPVPYFVVLPYSERNSSQSFLSWVHRDSSHPLTWADASIFQVVLETLSLWAPSLLLLMTSHPTSLPYWTWPKLLHVSSPLYGLPWVHGGCCPVSCPDKSRSADPSPTGQPAGSMNKAESALTHSAFSGVARHQALFVVHFRFLRLGSGRSSGVPN